MDACLAFSLSVLWRMVVTLSSGSTWTIHWTVQNSVPTCSSSTRSPGTSTQSTGRRLRSARRQERRQRHCRVWAWQCLHSHTEHNPETQEFTFLSPVDEGCSMLRNLFEFVTNDTHGEMNSCSGGVSIIEKDSEDRLVRAFLAPPACCKTAKNLSCHRLFLMGGHSPEAVEEGHSWQHACKVATLRLLLCPLHLFHLRQKRVLVMVL